MPRRVPVLVPVALALAAFLIAYVAVQRARPARVPRLGPAAAVPGLPSREGPVGTASPAARRLGAEAASRVEGTVRDALTAAPVAGVDVVFATGGAESTATSDAAGRFALDLAAGRYHVRASGDGVYGLAAAPLALGAGARVTSYDLIVARLATVHGRVLDAEGQPAPGATISFRTAAPRGRLGSRDLEAAGLVGTAQSGEGGSFELQVLPGEVVLSALRAGRRGQLTLPLVAPGALLSAAEIVLDPGGGVAGVVRDPAGRPVPRAHVVAHTDGGGPGGLPARATTTTGADGRFSILDLPTGPARLEARAAGFAPSAPLLAESSPDGSRHDIVLLLRAPSALRGRVLTPDGQPLAGARVTARHRRSHLESPSVTSAADGTFVFAELDPGPHDLGADAEGYGSAYRNQVGAPQEGIELRLQAVGGLAGVVTDGAGPVPDFQVRWRSVLLEEDTPGREGSTRFLAADGAFRLEGLSPGSYDLVVAAPGHAPARRRVSVTPAVFADASVVLEHGATLAGRVTSADGSAVVGARVEAMTGHEGDAILTDAEGRFVLADVAPGRRSLSVEHPAHVGRSESGLVLRAGERRLVDVKLTPLAAGEAAAPGARPVEFAGIGAVLMARADGVVLRDLVAGGPAERAGLVRGDLVVSVDGRPVVGRPIGDISEDIRGVAGTSVRLETVREGRSSFFDVVRGTVRFGG